MVWASALPPSKIVHNDPEWIPTLSIYFSLRVTAATSLVNPFFIHQPSFDLLKVTELLGVPGWLSGWVSAFGSGYDPRILGWSPTLGSLQGSCFSLCLCLHLSLCVSHEQINIKKTTMIHYVHKVFLLWEWICISQYLFTSPHRFSREETWLHTHANGLLIIFWVF